MTREIRHQITPDVAAILQAADITGNALRITAQLDRKMYQAVNAALELLGGKWNRSAKAHLFPSDPRATIAAALDAGDIRDTKRTFQQFNTPPDLAARMVEIAALQAHHRVLEPSAGTGNILRAIGPEPELYSIEIDGDITGRLGFTTIRQDLPRLTIHTGDFLTQTPATIGRFDRVIMNPPFTGGQGIRHIEHARKFLHLDGFIVAVLPDGPRERDAFMNDSQYWESLPAGTFKDADTMVSTVLFALGG